MAWSVRAMALMFVACSPFGASSAGGSASGGPHDGGDGTTDAADERDAGSPSPGGWCAGLSPRPTHCFDFDGDQQPVEAGWTRLEVTNGGVLTGQTGAARSQPNGVLVDISPNGPAPRARLELDLPTAPNKLALAFDVRPDQLGLTGPAHIAEIRQISKGAYFSFYVNATNAFFQEFKASQPPEDHYLPRPLAIAAWVRVAITLDLANAKLEVTLDGVPVASGSIRHDASVGAPTIVSIGTGQTNGSTDPWRFAFDNVVVDLQ